MTSGTRPLSTEEREAAAGAEVLLVDGEELVREGLRKLLTTIGVLVTATGDATRAAELVAQKHFVVAIVDVDTPATEEGLRLLREIKEASPTTALLLLTLRQTFDLAVRGFHAGAADVVAKTPENVRGLQDKVIELCRETRRGDSRDELLRDTVEVHDQFLKRLMDASRKAAQAEEVAQGHSGRWAPSECVVLVVDGDTRTAEGLQQALGKDSPYRFVPLTSGGEALDYAGQHRFQLALVSERLPDLPWSMVVKSLRGQGDGGIVMLLSNPSQGPGSVVIVEENRTIPLVPELTRGDQLVEAIQQMREGHLAKARERHYLQAFRTEHYEFLKRYVELKQRLVAAAPQGGAAKK